MQAILINPFERTVSAVEYNGDYKQISQLIDAEHFDVASIDRINGVFVDDEGLFKANDTPCQQQFFAISKASGDVIFLAGKALILATDNEGDSIPPTVTIADIYSRVVWISQEKAIPIAKHILSQSGQVFAI